MSLLPRQTKLLSAVALYCCCLGLISVHSADIIIHTFQNPECQGDDHTTTLPADSCLPLSYENYTSVEYQLHQGDRVFAVIQPNAGTNCSGASTSLKTVVECGKCLPSHDPAVKYYKYQCNMRGKYIIASSGCNTDCSSCTMGPGRVDIGSCKPYNNGSSYIKFDSLVKATTFKESLYSFGIPGNCTGALEEEYLPCGQCLAGTIFNCAVNGQQRMVEAPQKPLKLHLRW